MHTSMRKNRKSKRLGQGAGGAFGDGFRARLRSLITARKQSFSAFAKSCRLDPPRLSEWIAGEQLPSAEHLRRIAVQTGASLDWLLLGEGGDLPVYRGVPKTDSSLELDLAFEIRRFIHQRESEGAFDLDDGTGMRLALDRWIVDGAGLLSDLRRREEEKVRAWIEWEARTTALRGIADDIVEALTAIVPQLPPDDTQLGAHVYHLGRAAIEARAFGSGLGVPEPPNSFRGLHMRDHSHTVQGAAAALRQIESELEESKWDEPAPLADRMKTGAARLTPIKPWM